MILRIFLTLLWLLLVLLMYGGANALLLIETVLWAHKAYKRYWPNWGFKEFKTDLKTAFTAPWELR